MTSDTMFTATGRRKNAVARVFLRHGKGEFLINKRQMDEYLRREILMMLVRQPLIATNCLAKFNVAVNVRGGGLAGQAGAISHGIARALLKYDIALKPTLRKGHFLTRDPRMKERKKYGLKGARKRFQWTKR